MYNEATVVGSVIQELLQTFPNVVCVDDGSSDDSAAMARKAGAVVVAHPVNLGQGAALQTGFEYAAQDPNLDAVITFDADGQHRVQDAAAMLERVRAGEADVVLGSRFLDGRGEVSALKRLVLRTAAVQSRLSTGYRLTDAHNGLRALSADVVRNIHLTQNRMAHASELIHQFSALEARVVEQPVHIVYTEYSKSKGQSLLNGVNILADLFFR
ncbi:glycosyltransferase family 2 protein [Arthrobacter sp. CAU 1506]|uniref:glycosyltransferase family 2 protein n=1 Tax=Arthrobacter sp. CAU 1506 TaxID=2560052 RepID=UPI0010AB79DE|nr:glycosyltransferase family 2 protein [Arthrobacter sp. CAU 1506]TJY71621.1 glycosyltransferase family 2 protein [Arthrobacter sp. CAU 1506]